AALRRRHARGLAAAALREPRRRRLPRRRYGGVRGGLARRRRGPRRPRRRPRAARRRDRLLHRLRGVQARAAPPRPAVRLVPAAAAARARAVSDDRPEGLVYRPDLLTEDEERALLDELERLEFHEIRMHGVVAKRTAR